MNSKRGISALELQRHLGLKSYGLTWTMLQNIREALKQRDEDYQVGDGVIESVMVQSLEKKPQIIKQRHLLQ